MHGSSIERDSDRDRLVVATILFTDACAVVELAVASDPDLAAVAQRNYESTCRDVCKNND